MAKITIGEYLLQRLHELGIGDVFGVPGDYNLGFLDQISHHKHLNWIGNCNELNAAYAADGYARVRGMAAMVTTFGVGELSAINGIAGAYAEYVPVVKIVGAPSTASQQQGALLHHTFGTGDFKMFERMYEEVTTAQAIINNPETAAEKIDQVLLNCWIKKQPVYISLPSNMTHIKIDAPSEKLIPQYPASNMDAVNELVGRVSKLIRQAKSPVILADICALRHGVEHLVEALLDSTGIPVAVMNLGKGVVNESHPNYLGTYNGDFSSPGVQERVEKADIVLAIGSVMSDFNTGGFTAKMNANVTVELHSNFVKVRQSTYNNVYFNESLPALTQSLSDYSYQEQVTPQTIADYQAGDNDITQERFWVRMANFFEPKDIIVAETGTSSFGLMPMKIPEKTNFITQSLWGSIGYSVGAHLGAMLADRSRRSILFVGDGSFQLTAQEVSTMMRQNLNPIIFLINNDGYTIERVIHGPTMEYNDVQMWRYADLPAIFGDNSVNAKVSNEKELEQALTLADKNKDKLVFIEVMMERNDCPQILRDIGEACAQQNKYS